ncbi:ARF1 [Symbiodinium pilosum]|uniref:ARF1 protein n=1 Tax=Symbiodinium pilosum TaxID=2952 RepID=A0A812S663_SYMPI|nr:ARF1 [Symbiodinium pilosum]
MAAFVVYGAPPGRLYSEDISACAVQAFAALEAFVARGAAKVDKALDLTRCEKPSA